MSGIWGWHSASSKCGRYRVSVHRRIMLSDEESLGLPDTPGKRELLDGELIDLPPAKLYHSAIAEKLMHLLATVIDDSHLWIEAVYRSEERRVGDACRSIWA